MQTKTPKWQNLLNGPDAERTVVFSGGACNIITADGTKARNTGRDDLNAWLDSRGIGFFDPQIHEDTHGRGYDYDVDGPAEQTARAVAKVTLYELCPDTMGGVTHLEIMADAAKGKTLVVWLHGNVDAKGNQAFAPAFAPGAIDGPAAVHAAEYVANGSKLRKNLKAFLTGYTNVTFVTNEDEARQAISDALNC